MGPYRIVKVNDNTVFVATRNRTAILIIMSKEITSFDICGKIIEEEVFVGSFFLKPPSNCVVNSSLFLYNKFEANNDT